MDEFEQFRDTFFEECGELVEQYGAAANIIAADQTDPGPLDEMFRAVHSIKAGAAAFKFGRLVTFTHEFENLLEQLRGGEVTLTKDGPGILLRAGDVLQDLVLAAQAGTEAPAGCEDETLAQLRQMGNPVPIGVARLEPAEEMPTEDAGDRNFAITFIPRRSLYQSANEPQLLVKALQKLGALTVQIDTTGLPDLAEMDPTDSYFSWQFTLAGGSEAEIRDVFEFVEDDCQLVIERCDAPPVSAVEAEKTESANPNPARSSTNAPSEVRPGSIRVDLDRIDRLVDMVGELVIAQTMAVDSLVAQMDIRQTPHLQALEDLTLRTRQLQEGVMAVRMQPLNTLFTRFSRVVRELSDQLGKSVRLEVEGEATEVDKTIIEELVDPLTHIIRNSLDHGMETTEERVANGKGEQGVVHISAGHKNGRILIRIRDDGRGLDTVRIRQKAIENGLIEADAVMTKAQVENLIFRAGFSTADSVSDLSGRGVGMDVVRRNIQKLGGRVMVESTPGQGTEFTLALPLTLAVLDGMLVSVAEERYIVPISAIVESVCPQPLDIRTVPGGHSVLNLRSEAIRLVDVAAALNISRTGLPEALRKLVVIVETEFGRKVGLVVDQILGQQQVVIKTLEKNYKRVTGIAGTAILGDGRVRLILDVDSLAAASLLERAAAHPELCLTGGN